MDVSTTELWISWWPEGGTEIKLTGFSCKISLYSTNTSFLFFFLLWGHLQGEQVALQTVTNEDGLCTEQAEQHSLDIPQTDGGIFQILLCHTRESVTNTQNHQKYI